MTTTTPRDTLLLAIAAALTDRKLPEREAVMAIREACGRGPGGNRGGRGAG